MPDESSEDRESKFDRQLSSLFNGYDGPGFAIRLWDGWRWNLSQDRPACTLVVNTRDALAALAGGADEVTLGEAFIHKQLDVEGDLFSALSVAEFLMRRPRDFRLRAVESILACATGLKRCASHGLKHSWKRDQASIAYHYDQPVEFYRPWLGETLVYSCAYFRSLDDSLDDAQMQKLELVCRKLRMKAGDHFLDIGCGWGGLVLHAGLRHHVVAHGITLSREQTRVANQRIKEAGLDDRCIVEHRDYRSCREFREAFDVIASIGMFEHVGLPKLPLYFSAVRSLLKPGGAFLNHGIAKASSSSARSRSFIDNYVFPDGKLVTITEAINAAEGAGFEVRDVENLREHYDLTLHKWADGLERNKDALLKIVPEKTYRIWLLCMVGSARAFRRGDIGVHQILLSRLDRGCSRLPLVRDDWYRGEELELKPYSEDAHLPTTK